jgi:hypothetical protein
MAKRPGQRTRNWSAIWRGVTCCSSAISCKTRPPAERDSGNAPGPIGLYATHGYLMFLTPRNNGVFNGTFFQVIEGTCLQTIRSPRHCSRLLPDQTHQSCSLPRKESFPRAATARRLLLFPQVEIDRVNARGSIQTVGLEAKERFLASPDRCPPGGMLRKNLRSQEHLVAPRGNRLTNQPLDAS